MDIRKILRTTLLVLLILLACCGIGLPIDMRQKEDFGSEVRIELVEKKKDDAEDESEKEAKT